LTGKHLKTIKYLNAQHLGVRVKHVEAENRFLTALKGVADPE
jgi:GMP synthase PP-ATPase subunit